MSSENQISKAPAMAASTTPPNDFMRGLSQMPPEIIKKIVIHLRSENGVIGKAALALIRALRTVKGPDSKVHSLYETIVSEVYATSMNRLMFFHHKIIPHHSNPKNRFVNLVIPIAMPCLIGVPQALCPSPHILRIRLCLYGLRSETKMNEIVHTWINSLGSVEVLELQTHGFYERISRMTDAVDHRSVILPQGSSTEQKTFALHEYDMCKIDDMLGVVGKRSDGYGNWRENFICVWEVGHGDRLRSFGVNHIPEHRSNIYYALEPSVEGVAATT